MPGIFGSTILEVALGLFFVYFLLSIVCSAVNEYVALVLNSRAQDLEIGMRNLLRDPDVVSRMRVHPLIKDLTKSRYVLKAVDLVTGGHRDTLPSYIPSRLFALALLDVLAPLKDGGLTVRRLWSAAQERASGSDPEQKALGESLLALIADSQRAPKPYVTAEYLWHLVARVQDPAERQGLETALNGGVLPAIRAAIAALPQSQTRDDVLATISLAGANVGSIVQVAERLPTTPPEVGLLRNQLQAIVANAGGGLDGIRRYALQLPDTPARNTVLDLIEEGEGDIRAVRESVERWFDNAMDRMSGSYKRSVQRFLLLLSLLISAALNVDSIRIVDTLGRDASLRAALVAEAEAATTFDSAYATLLAHTPGTTDAPPVTTGTATGAVGPETTTEARPAATGSVSATVPLTPTARIEFVLGRLEALKAPIGWNDLPRAVNGKPPTTGDWSSFWLFKVAGLLATGFAVSLGAPFWFDTLTRVSSLRSAGPRPKKTDEDKPQARDRS